MRLALTLFLTFLVPALAGCTSLAGRLLAGGVTGSEDAPSVFASDDDPELIRDAIPFGLKVIEGFIAADAEDPHEDLCLAAASGFTQYAYAFVQQDAERLDEVDLHRSKELYQRARKLYARARGYGMRGLNALDEDFGPLFEKDREAALALFEDEEAVPLLYWTAVAWAAQISISKSDATLLGELPAMEAMMKRAYQLAPDWGKGSIHEFYIAYDGGRSESTGGSVKKAKKHFDRAVKLSNGRKVGPWVSWAESVSVQQQDKKTFNAYLDRALAFDVDRAPENRLANLIAQDRARRLKARVEDLFAE